MKKQKIELEPGKRYKGYALVNEYGEFEFYPEQKGSRQGQFKTVKETESYTLRTTQNLVVVHLRLPKSNGLTLIKHLMGVVNNLINDVKTYEF